MGELYYVYQISNAEKNVIYVGYTRNYHRRRLKHKWSPLFKDYDWETLKMRPVDKVFCEKEDAMAREQFWIDFYRTAANKLLNSKNRHHRVWWLRGDEFFEVFTNPPEIPCDLDASRRRSLTQLGDLKELQPSISRPILNSYLPEAIKRGLK